MYKQWCFLREDALENGDPYGVGDRELGRSAREPRKFCDPLPAPFATSGHVNYESVYNPTNNFSGQLYENMSDGHNRGGKQYKDCYCWDNNMKYQKKSITPW